MRRYLAGLSFHTKMTLTIAGAFVGAIAMILVIGLLAARSLGIGVVALNQVSFVDISATPDAGDAAPVQTAVTATMDAVGGDGGVVVSGASGGEISVVVGTVDGGVTRIGATPLERLPTLVRWSVVVLIVFAVLAVLIASAISRRSLGRIAEVTRLAREFSESSLDRRLNLPGPDDEIKQLGDTFDRMLDRLGDAMARQGRFVAHASHELRTPLTVTRTALEVPLAQGRVPSDLQTAFETALRANARSERLIAALLDLAQAEGGDLRGEIVSLSTAMHAALADSRAEPGATDLTWHVEVDPEVAVWGDPVLLDLMIRNLVENAVRHNVEDGEIWVCLRKDATQAIVTIANTGVVLAGPVDRLRDPFARDPASPRRTGHPRGFGLGLSLVDGVVVRHRGTVALAARDGGGLLVIVTMPRVTKPEFRG
ncbi:MAG: histidine kinase dimerization/phospho-acceptor domain-containing protein [Thermomicrobiales bacterium]